MPRYLGQHFLKDKKIITHITNTIASLYHLSQASHLVEIGPGKGALTKYIQAIANDFLVIEKDEQMKQQLLNKNILAKDTIIMSDILERDYQARHTKSLEPKHIVCGNLPYYITSPILRKFFEKETRAEGGVFLIQKEVADKIKHDAVKKSYLRWMLNNHYHVTYTKTVKAKAFSPAPKVTSAVIKLEKKAKPAYPDSKKLLQILDYISPYKRKTLGKIQKLVGKDHIVIPSSLHHLRPENLDRNMMTTIDAK